MAGAKVSIADLRPTQLTLGLAEVGERAAKIAAMTPADREAYLHRKPIPYVLGPGKQLYIVDHHHLARALWSLKIPEVVLGDRLADWSDLETKAFWRMMEFEGLLLAHRRRRQSQTVCRHSRINRRPYRQRLAHPGATLARQGVRRPGPDDRSGPGLASVRGRDRPAPETRGSKHVHQTQRHAACAAERCVAAR